MRSPERQKEFLDNGRFGEGRETLARKKIDSLVWIGLGCFALAALMIASLKVFQIGGHDASGFPLFSASILAVTVGLVLSIVGLFRMRSK